MLMKSTLGVNFSNVLCPHFLCKRSFFAKTSLEKGIFVQKCARKMLMKLTVNGNGVKAMPGSIHAPNSGSLLKNKKLQVGHTKKKYFFLKKERDIHDSLGKIVLTQYVFIIK